MTIAVADRRWTGVTPIACPAGAPAMPGHAGNAAPAAGSGDASELVCQCAKVDRLALLGAVQAGCRTVQALSNFTGAGQTCGGCLRHLAELVHDMAWGTARCIAVIDRALRVKSFRFEMPGQHEGCQIQPGQRLVVRATIDGLCIQRPYTLTSPATECGYYEITVQREPLGIMSNWLFDNMKPGISIELLPPSGSCTFELRGTRPLVCLVGGIGITPALGICRSAATSAGGRRMHVDYSVSTREQVVCADELRRLAFQHPSISCRVRITREEGRFRPDELQKLAAELSDCDWLICGSKRFREDAERLLREGGIELRKIHIESFQRFADVKPAAPATTAVLSPIQRTMLGYALLVAIGGFVAQALFGLKWPLLEQLQTRMVYSAITGAALLMMLMLQWRLAYVRVRYGMPKTARAYGLHIASGPAVLALLLMHSTHLGYGLSMAVCLGFLGSLATGCVLSAHPKSSRWRTGRSLVLGCHIALSCAGSGLAVVHGINALWY